MEKDKYNQIHDYLTEKIKVYIKVIIEKYGEYIPNEVMNRLTNITDYKEILKIYDYNEVNAYATSSSINMPLCADKLLNIAKKIPGYGINKKHQTYNDNNIITNNNTFLTYVTHVFISGTDAQGYFDDMLLHETLHYCGSDGASALKEGINELLTRKLALEYGFRTNACGYPKEVKLAYRLQEVLGERIINHISFIKDESQIYAFLEYNIGIRAVELYKNISKIMEEEFSEKYYNHMEEFSGALGILKKTLYYEKIDYSAAYNLIESYNLEKTEKYL